MHEDPDTDPTGIIECDGELMMYWTPDGKPIELGVTGAINKSEAVQAAGNPLEQPDAADQLIRSGSACVEDELLSYYADQRTPDAEDQSRPVS